MATCGFDGNADMYGVGIRVGFYIQWYSSIIASWISRSEVPAMRISNLMFVSATFLATIIQTVEGKIRPVEIYISLLLAFGGYLYLIPLLVWRVLTVGKAQWDPTRYPRVRMGKIFSILNFVLLVSVSVFQLWFWTWGYDNLRVDNCPDYGFFFIRFRLNVIGFVVVNIMVNGLLLLCCLGILGLMVARLLGMRDSNSGKIIKPQRKLILQVIHTVFNTTVATAVSIATELTIHWNGISGVADISSAGQLIPLVIGIEMFVRVFYAAWMNEDQDSSAVDDSSTAGSLTNFPDIAIQEVD